MRYGKKTIGRSSRVITKSLAFFTATGGWRNGVIICASSTFVVCLLNLSILIWSASRGTVRDWTTTIYNGNCDKAGHLNIVLHFVIGVLGTVLLSSSNYCMQCLSAPTREEVDRLHSKKRWLHIGVLSTRNLSSISKKRVTLWLFLGISSLPVHLFSNSQIFWTTTSTTYTSILATTAFAKADARGKFVIDTSATRYGADTTTKHTFEPSLDEIRTEAIRLQNLASKGKLQQLGNRDCIEAYATQFSPRGSVLVLVKSPNITVFGARRGDNNWVCLDGDLIIPCDVTKTVRSLRANPWNWTLKNRVVAYCLSEIVSQQCIVRASNPITIGILILCVAKFLITSLILKVDHAPLVTIGDAVASFLSQPDSLANGVCVTGSDTIERWTKTWTITEPSLFKGKNMTLNSARTEAGWSLYAYIMLQVILMGVLITLLTLAIQNVTRSGGNADTLIQLGIGRISTMTILKTHLQNKGGVGLIANTFVSNLPQLVLSLFYFYFNSLFTTISTVFEWESYAQSHKGLRLSTKVTGKQRSSYFLTLPYRLSVPLLLFSALLQWLASQAIFLINIESQEYITAVGKWKITGSYFTCGYSPLAIIIALALGILLVAIPIGMRFVRFKTTTPIVANCSAAIAAACHVPPWEDGNDTAVSEVQWGVVAYDVNGVGHCSFSSSDVMALEEGKVYEAMTVEKVVEGDLRDAIAKRKKYESDLLRQGRLRGRT
ncbi:hypothetical protein BDV96DRAFT_660673 [Lophiotrema nucula]|uniref:DUF6536 domain-containing protein n=1 Tax=Lophiotrema nucula TaxID=690887 RepID=A0A6A5Z5L5_9PLEO|nr:hypothetical protein BDV96DRAFT_660673 [Lophiotrema nucula]